MEIARAQIDDLTSSINGLSKAGQKVVRESLAKVEWSSIEELREAVAEIMEAVCAEVSGMSAAYAAEFYDDVRESSVGSRLGAVAESGRSPDATYGAVKAMIQSVVVSGTLDAFARQLADRVDYEAKRAAGEAMYRNGTRDPLEPRFARVPTGSETCPFCIMLASRGFVYRNTKTAGSDGHYHPNCDCRIVPGFQGETTVAGYDIDALYERYTDDVAEGRLNLRDVEKYSTATVAEPDFEGYSDYVSFIEGAENAEDLQRRWATVRNRDMTENELGKLVILNLKKRRELLESVG